MATLTGKIIKDTYQSLLKVNDNGQLAPTLQQLTDGLGNGSGISINTSGDLKATGILEFGSLKDTGENINISKFVDAADGIASNDNDTTIPTTAAIIDYVAAQITLEDLDFSGDTGTGSVDLDSQSFRLLGANGVVTTASGQTITIDTSSLDTRLTTAEADIDTNTANITAEETARIAADTTLQNNIDAEASTRSSADTTLQTNIDNEAATRLANDNTLQSNIDAETSARTTADSTLQSNIDSEAATRLANDNTLQSNIDTEASTRASADTALQGQIDSNDTDIATNASNIATNTANISSNDTDISGLDSRLTTAEGNITSNDTDIATNAANIATNVTDIATNATNISSNDTDITALQNDKYDKTGGTISGSVTITNDLTVNGTTTTVNTETLSVKDPLIEMANDNAANSVDTGFYANYSLDAGVTSKYAGLFKDASDSDTFKLFKGLEVEPTTTVDTAGTGYSLADLDVAGLSASSGTISGNLTVDTDTLFVDSSNNRVGIGISSPDSLLHIFGNTGTDAIPKIKLEASGWSNDCRIERSSGADGFYITNNYDTYASVADNTGAGTSGVQMTRGDLRFHTGSSGAFSERMRIDSSGRVGIGLNNPNDELHVYGNANGVISTRVENGFSGTAATAEIWAVANGNNFRVVNYPDADTTNANRTDFISSAGGSYFTFSPSTSERMRIDSSGNVGIGTDSIAANLHIRDTGSTSSIFLDSTATSDQQNRIASLRSSGGAYSSLLIDAGTHIFRTGTTERMRITSSGNLGIGTTSPSAKINIESNAADQFMITRTGVGYWGLNTYSSGDFVIDNGVQRMRITSGGSVLFGGISSTPSASVFGGSMEKHTSVTGVFFKNSIDVTTTATHAQFINPNGTVGTIQTSGSSTSYNTSSDYRLKENVVPMEGALDRVDALKPSRFNFIADADKTVDGFLAHEVAEVVPEAISGEKDAVDEDGNAIYQGIDQSKLVPLLVGAIQELKGLVQSQQAEIELLKQQLNK